MCDLLSLREELPCDNCQRKQKGHRPGPPEQQAGTCCGRGNFSHRPLYMDADQQRCQCQDQGNGTGHVVIVIQMQEEQEDGRQKRQQQRGCVPVDLFCQALHEYGDSQQQQGGDRCADAGMDIKLEEPSADYFRQASKGEE